MIQISKELAENLLDDVIDLLEGIKDLRQYERYNRRCVAYEAEISELKAALNKAVAAPPATVGAEAPSLEIALDCDECPYYRYVRCLGSDCSHLNAPEKKRGRELLAENRIGDVPKWCPLTHAP